MGSLAPPIYEGRTVVDLLKCSDRRNPKAAGGWLIGDSLEPYVPPRGPLAHYSEDVDIEMDEPLAEIAG